MAPCALLISPSSEGWFLPALLAQAGWQCDVVSLSEVFGLSAHVRRLHLVHQVARLGTQALQVFEQAGGYAWVRWNATRLSVMVRLTFCMNLFW